MDVMTDHLAAARDACQRRDWSASYAAFVRADGAGPMPLADLDAFATAAWRSGHASEAVRLAERVYGQMVRADPAAAAMEALDIALLWLTRGNVNVGRGWMDCARRLLKGAPVGPSHGYLAYLDATLTARIGHVGELAAKAVVARDVCAAIDDPSLASLSSFTEALAAFYGGRSAEAHGLVDRAIPAVESGEMRLEWAGDVYGLLLHACRALADPPSAKAWANSMQRWCEAHNALIYHRVLRIYLVTSEYELLTASSALDGVHGLAAGDGFDRLGHLRRQRGDADGALVAFASARRLGVG